MVSRVSKQIERRFTLNENKTNTEDYGTRISAGLSENLDNWIHHFIYLYPSYC
jgi:hypothetical protein